MKDLEKRKRVMQRSIRLGHCICNPKKPCPCDLFKERDICLCAGERLEPASGPVRLTRLVENAGCASKIDQASLKRALKDLPFLSDPRVLVGAAAGDDAGVYQLDGNIALVQTVDVFTPCVDDPYTFGQIAAANSVSDIYAMGGRPLTALSILGFPIREVADTVMRDILRGGLDKMAEAKVAVIGGHSINDKEIKAGFAVTGLIHPDKIMTNAGAQPGDVFILTKPLGTGILAFAAQIDRAPAGAMDAAARSMATLNKTAAELMVQSGAHACTDITGFGLMGHMGEVASHSNVDVEIILDDIPLFPGVLQCMAEGIIPGAVERNRESSAQRAVVGENVQPALLDICFDAQTSGGLLIVLPKPKAKSLLTRLHKSGISDAAIIGRVLGPGSGRVFVRTNGTRVISSSEPAKVVAVSKPSSDVFRASAGRTAGLKAGRHAGLCAKNTEECCAEKEKEMAKCCSEGHGANAPTGAASGVTETQQKFMDFMAAANAPGALDAHTKQAIAIALSVLAKCEPCTKTHIKKARNMGFSQEEIDEAAWMAIAFGGSPIMMFYNSVKNS